MVHAWVLTTIRARAVRAGSMRDQQALAPAQTIPRPFTDCVRHVAALCV
jgi:hypothetical protein